MGEAEFDRYAEEYNALHAASIAASGEDPVFFAEYKIRDIARETGWPVPSRGLAATARPLQVCDFGAGIGSSVPQVRKHLPGSQLTCVDVSRRSLDIAERRFPGMATYVHFGGSQLPLPDHRFDIVFASCVFHHIDPAEHGALLRELHRILLPGGTIFVFEHNPWNPLTMRAVRRCPFDENAQPVRGATMKHLLRAAGFSGERLRYRIFFPHAFRILRPLERALTWLPLGAQYYALARK